MIIDTRQLDGVTYYSTSASDGWPTGPCPSAEKCLERIAAYERGEEVSEAAPQQCSRAQMGAFWRWAVDAGIRDGGEIVRTARAAVEAGLHSDEWARASRVFISIGRRLPPEVIRAGGARIRKAADEPSLARGVRS